MAIVNNNGHGVTTVLPKTADGVQVAPVTMPFQEAPANQSGGPGGPPVTRDSKGSFPPAGTKSTPNSSLKGKQSSTKTSVYGQ